VSAPPGWTRRGVAGESRRDGSSIAHHFNGGLGLRCYHIGDVGFFTSFENDMGKRNGTLPVFRAAHHSNGGLGLGLGRPGCGGLSRWDAMF